MLEQEKRTNDICKPGNPSQENWGWWTSSATSVRNRGELCYRRGQFLRWFHAIKVMNALPTLPGHNKISLAILPTLSSILIRVSALSGWVVSRTGRPYMETKGETLCPFEVRGTLVATGLHPLSKGPIRQ